MTAKTGASEKRSKSRSKQPIDLESDNPSENSRLHAATSIQSSVQPGDYPETERSLQVAAGTDGASGSGDSHRGAKARHRPARQP